MAHEELERKVELAYLTAFYGGILTERQRYALTLHCEEDMSLSEIGQEIGVSRQAVHELLARAADKLFEMENKLRVAERFRRAEAGLVQCREALRQGRVSDAEKLLDQLIQQETEDGYGL